MKTTFQLLANYFLCLPLVYSRTLIKENFVLKQRLLVKEH